MINEPLRRGAGGYEPLFDLEPAREYGDLVHVLPAGKLPADPTPSIARMQTVLKAYAESDYLLLVGDLVMMSAACALAARTTGGVVSVLTWQSDLRRYTARVIRIY